MTGDEYMLELAKLKTAEMYLYEDTLVNFEDLLRKVSQAYSHDMPIQTQIGVIRQKHRQYKAAQTAAKQERLWLEIMNQESTRLLVAINTFPMRENTSI